MSPYLMKALSEPLIEAALDQPSPTRALVYALNRVLFSIDHLSRPLCVPQCHGHEWWEHEGSWHCFRCQVTVHKDPNGRQT